VTLADLAGVMAGMFADIAGMPQSAWNQTGVELLTVDEETGLVTYSFGATTTSEVETGYAVLALQTTWINDAYVATLLGFTPTGVDAVYLSECVHAAGDWAWRKRQEAGYTSDHPNVSPGADARLGTGLYALSLFRERGSVDSFQSFQDMPTPGWGSLGQIMKLLGINKPKVA
jgi:hypothetical protein